MEYAWEDPVVCVGKWQQKDAPTHLQCLVFCEAVPQESCLV